MITLTDYYMGRDELYAADLTPALQANACVIVERANALLARAACSCEVSSGWRPPTVNAAVTGASPTSKHLSCQAIDLEDEDGSLDAWCLAHLDVLEELGLWLEAPEATPGWCHLQTVPPRSGNRVFEP